MMSLRFYQWVPLLAFTVVIVLLCQINSNTNSEPRLVNTYDKNSQLKNN